MQAHSCLPMIKAGFCKCERPVTQDRDSAGLSIKACFQEFDGYHSISLSEYIEHISSCDISFCCYRPYPRLESYKRSIHRRALSAHYDAIVAGC